MLLTRLFLPTLFALSQATTPIAPVATSGEIFDEVVSVLDRWYYDKDFRSQKLPGLAAGLRERAHRAPDGKTERVVIKELLAQIPSSHLALISVETYRRVGSELASKALPTFGLQLIKLDGRYHATWVYEGGAAERAGILRGDEVLTIDGLAPAASPLLDWSTDDAALPDAEIHDLLAEDGARIRLEMQRGSGESFHAELVASDYCGALASEASVRIIEQNGQRLGYVHFWYMAFDTPSSLLKRVLTDDFADCDGLVLDLRGRGGSALECGRIKALLDPESGEWGRPLVALIDRSTRSAKEVIALEIKQAAVGQLVGERTAGAVVPAAFREVGGGAVLMFPWMTIGKFTDQLEGKGVAPDLEMADRIPYSAGADPILQAGIKRLLELHSAGEKSR
ncbi:MAG: carboxyl-terminal processing protease [Candidatus Paceibacteria bacterium]|jgi:carboxyl-terminal processing protease